MAWEAGAVRKRMECPHMSQGFKTAAGLPGGRPISLDRRIEWRDRRGRVR